MQQTIDGSEVCQYLTKDGFCMYHIKHKDDFAYPDEAKLFKCPEKSNKERLKCHMRN